MRKIWKTVTVLAACFTAMAGTQASLKYSSDIAYQIYKDDIQVVEVYEHPRNRVFASVELPEGSGREYTSILVNEISKNNIDEYAVQEAKTDFVNKDNSHIRNVFGLCLVMTWTVTIALMCIGFFSKETLSKNIW